MTRIHNEGIIIIPSQKRGINLMYSDLMGFGLGQLRLQRGNTNYTAVNAQRSLPCQSLYILNCYFLQILQCPSSFDSVLCWPRTNAGSLAVLPCFEEFKGVHYDTTGGYSRLGLDLK